MPTGKANGPKIDWPKTIATPIPKRESVPIREVKPEKKAKKTSKKTAKKKSVKQKIREEEIRRAKRVRSIRKKRTIRKRERARAERKILKSNSFGSNLRKAVSKARKHAKKRKVRFF